MQYPNGCYHPLGAGVRYERRHKLLFTAYCEGGCGEKVTAGSDLLSRADPIAPRSGAGKSPIISNAKHEWRET